MTWYPPVQRWMSIPMAITWIPADSKGPEAADTSSSEDEDISNIIIRCLASPSPANRADWAWTRAAPALQPTPMLFTLKPSIAESISEISAYLSNWNITWKTIETSWVGNIFSCARVFMKSLLVYTCKKSPLYERSNHACIMRPCHENRNNHCIFQLELFLLYSLPWL